MARNQPKYTRTHLNSIFPFSMRDGTCSIRTTMIMIWRSDHATSPSFTPFVYLHVLICECTNSSSFIHCCLICVLWNIYFEYSVLIWKWVHYKHIHSKRYFLFVHLLGKGHVFPNSTIVVVVVAGFCLCFFVPVIAASLLLIRIHFGLWFFLRVSCMHACMCVVLYVYVDDYCRDFSYAAIKWYE